MKNSKIATMLAGIAILGASTPALAVTHTGMISTYAAHGAFAGRGACVQTVPAIPNTWACVWKTNALYDEITSLLLQAYIADKTCLVGWSSVDSDGYPKIDVAECY